MSVRPVKTQISLGRCPGRSDLPRLIRVLAVHMKKPWVLSYPLSAQRRLWSNWANVQADLSLRWAHSRFVGFVMSWFNYFLKWAREQQNLYNKVHPSQTQTSLGIFTVSSVFAGSSLGGQGPIVPSCGQRKTDQTARLSKLKWVLLACTFPPHPSLNEPHHERACLVSYEGCSEITETLTIMSKRLNVIQNNLHSH